MFNLKISFPKSSEDHRLQLVSINGSTFAIIHSPLESRGPIRLHCEGWSLILLAPIKSEASVEISGVNVLCLNEIVSKEEKVTIEATNQLVSYTPLIHSSGELFKLSSKNQSQFDDDPGSLIFHYQLFNGIAANAVNGSVASLSQAQKNFVAALSTLAEKIKGTQKRLSLSESLDVWDVFYLETTLQESMQ